MVYLYIVLRPMYISALSERVHFFPDQMKAKMICLYLLIGFHISRSSSPYDFVDIVTTLLAHSDLQPGQMATSWSSSWCEGSVLCPD